MTIPEIKSRLPITEVLAHYGHRPSTKGTMPCPFHNAESKSKKKTFQVYTDTNRYQCFHKDCTAGNGDVIDFIEKQEGCSKHKAIEKAKTLAGQPNKDTKNAHSDDDPGEGSVLPHIVCLGLGFSTVHFTQCSG